MSSGMVIDTAARARIHVAIENMCAKMSESEDTLRDLKEEMASNLEASVCDLLEQGHPINAAVDMAIERFGATKKDIIAEFSEIYRVQRVFAKGLLLFTVVIGLIGVLCTSFYLIWNNKITPYYEDRVMRVIETLTSQEQIRGSIPKNIEAAVEKQLDGNPYIAGVGMRLVNDSDTKRAPFQYVYPKSMTQVEVHGVFAPVFPRGPVYLAPNVSGDFQIQGTKQTLFVQFVARHCSPQVFIVGLSLLFLYWSLFAVWGILNLIYNRKLRIWSVILIIFFNVIGYMAYSFINRRLRSLEMR